MTTSLYKEKKTTKSWDDNFSYGKVMNPITIYKKL